jgi:hypothetical protein
MPSLLAHSLFARQNPLDEARNTLSSWDNCMAKAYCKCVATTGLRLPPLCLQRIDGLS